MVEQAMPYKRQYRSEPRPEAIRGSDYVKCMLGTFAAIFSALCLWLML